MCGFSYLCDYTCFPTCYPGDLRPPEVDSSPPADILDPSSCHFLLKMFMSELDAGTGEEGATPSPSPCQGSPCSKQSTSVECINPNGLDDPFLMEFTDIDGLLHETNVLNPFPTSPDFSVTPSPIGNVDPFFDLSDCVSPFSSSSDSEVTFDFSEDALGFNGHEEQQLSPLLSQQLVVVNHDHSYAAMPTESEPKCTSSRKQNLHKTAAGGVKKTKPMVKDQRYFVRRQKNNIASQSSRAKRRTKNATMFGRVGELEAVNAELRAQVEQLTTETEKLKKLLIDRLAQ